MSESDLLDAIIALMTYDVGATDAGIRDEALRARVIAQLLSMPADDKRRIFAVYAREYFLSDEGIAQGYGIEDVAE